MRPVRKAALVLATIVLTAGPSPAATSRWAYLGPYGGSIESVTVDPTNPRVVYATLGAQGGFKSTNGGASWTLIRDDAASVAVDPSQPNTVYLVSSDSESVFKSSDGGSHWAALGSLGALVSGVAVDPVIPSRIYAGTSSGVWRSIDRGASWSPARVPPPDGFSAKAVIPARPHGRVFALTYRGLYRSTDGGQSWAFSGDGLSVGDLLALAVDPADPGRVYVSLSDGLFRSVDGGVSWAPTLGQPAGSGTVLSLAVSAQGVWAGTETGLFRSADGGATWAAAGPPRRITAVAIAPSSPRTVYLGTTADSGSVGGVFASTDGGATWARRNQGITGLTVTDLEMVHGIPGWLWIGTSGQSVHVSRDGGRSWTRAPLKLPSSIYFSLASSPADALLLYAYSWPQLWRTLDGGITWNEILPPPGSPGPLFGQIWADPNDASTLWGPGWVSRDGGDTWAGVSLPAFSYCSLGNLVFAPSSSILYMSGATNGIPDGYGPRCRYRIPIVLRSMDGGASWAAVRGFSSGRGLAGPLAVDPLDPRLVYVGLQQSGFSSDASGLWKSVDAGDTWTSIRSLAYTQVSALAAPRAGVVWAARFDYVLGLRILRSGDAGRSWQDTTKNLRTRTVYELVADPANPRRVYAATSNGVWVVTETD
jgi:photosystem II stability/assembly factor-like uncharacterized protein